MDGDALVRIAAPTPVVRRVSPDLAYLLATLPAYGFVVWANRRWARHIDPKIDQVGFLIPWLVLCVAIPVAAGALAAWAVS